VQAAIAALGYPVQIHQKDMPNYERVTDFFDKVKAGENAFVAVYEVRAYGSGVDIWGKIFEKDEAGFYKRYIGNELELTERYPLKDIVLTEHGNLIAYEADDGGGPASGFRVLPLPTEYREAYEKYVRLVDTQSDGVINRAWSQDHAFQYLAWDLVFEAIWERESGQRLLGEGSPYYHGNMVEPDPGDAAIVPADVVEGTLQKYFNVSSEVLRKMTDPYREGDEAVLYHPIDNTYRIWGFRGGGYKPAVEVWGITENADGSISLELAWVSLDFGNDGSVYSTLTVMPQSDGGFKYISNIYSEDTVKGIVERSLELTGSLEMIHQGGFETTGESVEKNGYRFAEVDIEKLYQGDMKLGGVSGTESIKRWFYVIFEKEAADKYIRQIFDTPLYIDAGKDGDETLFVNQDVKGARIAQGEWLMEGFTVLENTPERITVQMKLDTPDGKVDRKLTLVPAARNNWLLTDSYEGNMG